MKDKTDRRTLSVSDTCKHFARMHRVLSFQMGRNTGESSEYVTKRLCFSFLFSVGFFCLLCGFLLGRFAVERSMEARMQKTRLELADNGLRNTEYLQQLALRELQETSFDHDYATNWKMPNYIEAEMRHINVFFTNLSFIHEVNNHTSCVHATVRGSREPDRYIFLSVNGDGITITLEMVQVLDRIYSAHNWRPRRSLIFCMSLVPSDVCSQTLPNFLRRKVVAYVTVHGYSLQADGYVTLSGSDIMRSIAIEAVKTIPGNGNWTYLEREGSDPRLFLDIPQVSFLFNESNLTRNQIRYDQNLRLHAVTLAQMISQTIWRLSESIIIKWEPKYFNETINNVLESINIDKFHDAIAKLKRALRILLVTIKDLNIKIDAIENTQTLRIRIWNDLLLDLDRALLCPDESFHSKTDLVTLRKLSLESTNNTLNYLDDMKKCYENAIQILQK